MLRWGSLAGLLMMIACGSRAERTAVPADTVRFAGEGVIELDVPGPVGSDPGIGGHWIGGCFLGIHASPHQSGLEPGALGSPAEYLYRVTQIHGEPVRWATFRIEDPTGKVGAYRVALYRPGVLVDVACTTPEARERAADWLATIRFVAPSAVDRSGVTKITGPATWAPAPDLCTQSSEPPIGGTSVATVRIQAPPDASISRFEVRAPDTKERIEWESRGGPLGAPAELFVPAGTYTIDIEADDRPTVRCAPVELRPGQVTTVRVQRFYI